MNVKTALLDDGDNGRNSFWMPTQPKASFGTESQVNVRVNADTNEGWMNLQVLSVQNTVIIFQS